MVDQPYSELCDCCPSPTLFAVPGVQTQIREQEGGPADPVQGAGHVSAGERPVQADGQPAEGASPGTQEEVQGADCEWSRSTYSSVTPRVWDFCSHKGLSTTKTPSSCSCNVKFNWARSCP